MIELPNKILRKETSTKLYLDGVFGNLGQTWNSAQEYFDSGYSGIVMIRSKSKIGGGIYVAETDIDGVRKYLENNPKIKQEDLWVNAVFPKDLALLQGNYLGVDPFGNTDVLEYNNTKGLHLRDAMIKDMKVSKGLTSLLILKNLMTSASWDDFDFLRSTWPDAAIELSIYSVNVGQMPHRNTMFWEVRHY
mgnify:FL=1